METRISIEVHPLQPSWIREETPVYRLYVNDELITERTWIWNNKTFIEENLLVDIPRGSSNSIKLELIKKYQIHIAQFGLQNLKINGWEKPDHGGHRSELSFVLA